MRWTAVGAAAGAAALIVWMAPCRKATPPATSGAPMEAAVASPVAGSEGLFHPDSPLGLSTGIGMIPPKLFDDYDLAGWPAEARRDAEMMSRTGAGWYRHHTSHFPAFDQAALKRDDFDFEYRDGLVAAAQAEELDILLMIGRTHGLASCRQWRQYLARPYLPPSEPVADGYREYVRRVVERYDFDGVDDMPGLKAPIRWFQLGNENDLHAASCADMHRDYATPEQYLAVVRMTKEAMVAAHPESRLAASMTFGPRRCSAKAPKTCARQPPG